MANPLAVAVKRINSLFPASIAPKAITWLFNSNVKFALTSGIRIEKLTPETSVVTVGNRWRVRNHIGTVHACAVALVAESATGMLFGMHVPATHIPVIKSMHIDFKKRVAPGPVTATATLQPGQVAAITGSDKGDTVVAVTVTDSSGREPVQCEMVWAWAPKRRDS